MIKHEVKWGAVLSYALIIINAVYGFIITPYIISSIGRPEYGVYKTISSLSSSLLVLDLGLGGTVMRYVAKYKSENKKDKIASFVSMAFIEGIIIIGVLAIVCGVIYTSLPKVYGAGLNASEIILAKKLFIILSANIILHILENLMNGIISGHNKFVRSSLVLVLIDFVLTAILLVVEYIYVRKSLKVKIRLSLKNWDMPIFAESFKYTLLLFITSIVAQMNNNLDNVVIGAIMGANSVAIYSICLLIFGMFENLSTAISGIMLPTITNILRQEDSSNKVQL